MLGEAFASLTVFLDDISSLIRNDCHLSQGVEVCLLVFGNNVISQKPLSIVDDTGFTNIAISNADTDSNLGKGLECILAEVLLLSDENYMPPMIIVMSDGYPSDLALYDEMVCRLKQHKFSSVAVCLAGQNPDDIFMKLLSDQIFFLDSMDSSSFSRLIEDAYYANQLSQDGPGAAALQTDIFID